MLLAEVHHFGLRVEIGNLKQASYWTHEYREAQEPVKHKLGAYELAMVEVVSV